MKTSRILELDGLRAFAVLLVVVYHMVDIAGAIPGGNQWVDSTIANLGATGVHIFFVISGFIITSLLLKEKNTTGDVSLTSFYTRRFFRIIPPFAVYLFTIFLLNQVGYISVDPTNFLWSSLFLGNLSLFGDSMSASGWFFGHSWSLSVEEQYYLILPPIMVGLKLRQRPVNALIIGLFCLSLLSLKIAKELSDHVHPGLIRLTTFFQFRYIIVGVLMALHKNRIQTVLRGSSVFLPICLAAIIMISPFVDLPPILPIGVEAVACGLFVLWFVENSARCALLRWRSVQWIGSCSYSIYLWQQLFTGKASFYSGWTIAQSPLALLAILICAALSYYLIEKPSIRLGRYVSGKVVAKGSISGTPRPV